jgi:uncharacterized protein
MKKKNLRGTPPRKSSFDVKKIIIYCVALLFVILIYIYLANLKVTSEPVISEPQTRDFFFRKDGNLNIMDNTGAYIVTIDIEIADDDHSRVRGLMHRQSMQEDQGMLFIFDRVQTQSMWMRNTYIPLDMLFIRDDMSIAHIAENTVPFSDDQIVSGEPVRYVLEVNAGFCQRYGIEENYVVSW